MGVDERRSDASQIEAAPTVDVLDEKKLKYPKSVFFIISNEFCERFSYYGMRTILSIYLTDALLFSESDAKITYHTFTALVYFFPVFGAMLADSWLGKFKTILFVSMIYACGNVLLALTSTKPLDIPQVPFTMVGLLLIALGTGGIKPCVAAFGGDQFVVPQQAKQLATFFSIFYFSINSGSFVSTFITPLLRDMECFESENCFTLAFGVPGVLMVVSIIIFALGRPLYRMKDPEGNMVITVSKCIGNAISQKSKDKSKAKKDHWMDYAVPAYGQTLVDDIKAMLHVLVLYIPLPVFWALFDQQGTGWTFMARRMDGDLGFYTILPDQVQVINPVLILAFIPLFDVVIYPLLSKCNILKTPLQRLTMGGILAAVAFCISAGISIAIEAGDPVLPEAGYGQVTFYNFKPTEVTLLHPDGKTETKVGGMDYTLLEESVEGLHKNYVYKLDGNDLELKFIDEETWGYYIDAANKAQSYNDSIAKNEKGLPAVTTVFAKPVTGKIEYHMDDTMEDIEETNKVVAFGHPGEYYLKFGDFKSDKMEFRLGGVYTVLVDNSNPAKITAKSVMVTKYNDVHMLWLIPQYVVITAAEIMFSITGLEFSYSQAPVTMKSVLQACWLLTTAFGNIIVIIIEAAEPFEEQSNNFFLYAGIMVADMFVFAWLAMRYKYVDNFNSKPAEGIDNGAYSSSQEKNEKP